MKKIILPVAISALLASMSSISALELRFGHSAPTGDLQQALAEFFAERLAEETGGEVTVQIFPQGQLGNDQQMISSARSGILDIFMVGLNNLTGLMPELDGIHLPYILDGREHAYAVLDGEVGQAALARFNEFGLQGLGFPENGFRNVTNNRGPIVEPSDLAGLVVRTNDAPALNQMFDLLGANPQPLPVSELYTALETGVVDAQEHPIPITFSFRYDEVQDYLSLTEHSYAPLAIAINLDRFNGMTEDQQDALLRVAQEAVEYQRNLAIESEDEVLSALEQRGMEINRNVNKAAFQEIVRPVWDTYIAEYGSDMIDAIENAKP